VSPFDWTVTGILAALFALSAWGFRALRRGKA